MRAARFETKTAVLSKSFEAAWGFFATLGTEQRRRHGSVELPCDPFPSARPFLLWRLRSRAGLIAIRNIVQGFVQASGKVLTPCSSRRRIRKATATDGARPAPAGSYRPRGLGAEPTRSRTPPAASRRTVYTPAAARGSTGGVVTLARPWLSGVVMNWSDSFGFVFGSDRVPEPPPHPSALCPGLPAASPVRRPARALCKPPGISRAASRLGFR
jgi:hypothetical protein